jgi:thiosulfate/3-mercaptopyruvate sulfurtransferase
MEVPLMASYSNDVLVETDWLADHAKDPNVRVFEVDVDTSAYDQGHVAGAIGLNWKTDLQQQPVRDLISKKELESLLSKYGVTPTTTIIAYGDNNNWFAAWFFWLLKYYGHKDVKLVNGGRAKWIAEKRPLSNDTPALSKSEYRAGTPDASIRALRDYVLDTVVSERSKIVDVRSPKEYAGELLAPENLPQEGAQRGGHIPGAQNIPWATAVAEDGRFKSADELASIYGGKGIDGQGETIAYCRIGERSAHTWFVLKYLLGHERVRNYDGSWTEWGSLIGVPIEKSAV